MLSAPADQKMSFQIQTKTSNCIHSSIMSVFDSLEATWDVVKSENYREQAIRVLNSFWGEKRVCACSPLLRLRLTWACCWVLVVPRTHRAQCWSACVASCS